MADSDAKMDKKGEMEGQILDPLQSATSLGSDWTMISNSTDRVRRGKAAINDQDDEAVKDQKYDCELQCGLEWWRLNLSLLLRNFGRSCHSGASPGQRLLRTRVPGCFASCMS